MITTGNQIDPNGVAHPAHYNTHPSGIETAELIRHMPHNIGAAVKYVMRRGQKVESGLTREQAAHKDLGKALWFLRDQLNVGHHEAGIQSDAWKCSGGPLKMAQMVEAELRVNAVCFSFYRWIESYLMCPEGDCLFEATCVLEHMRESLNCN